MEDLNKLFDEHPFTKKLKPAHQTILATSAVIEAYDIGHSIFRAGEDANNFYLIVTGEVALELHTPENRLRTLQFLRDGEVLGWSWLIAPYQWRFGARASKPTKLLVLDGKLLRITCEENPEFGYAILKQLALIIGKRLEITQMRLLSRSEPEQF